MCQIALSKSTKKVVTVVTTVTVVTVVRKITQPHHKKNLTTFFFIIIFNFLSYFGKGNLTHLTTDVMFSGQRFAILAMFLTKCEKKNLVTTVITVSTVTTVTTVT